MPTNRSMRFIALLGAALMAVPFQSADWAQATTGNGSPSIQRISGDDRYKTAIAVSQHGWANAGATGQPGQIQAGAVVLARGDQYADALAGVPFAGTKNAPILLTEPTTLRDDVRAEIQRVLAPGGTVYVLGGTSAISAAIEQQIAGLGYAVNRFQGGDRFHTALAIAEQGFPNLKQLYVATGTDYPDALVAGPLAVSGGSYVGVTGTPAAPHGALLLTNDFALDPDVAAFIRSFEASHPHATVAVGGHATEALKTIGPVYTTFNYIAGGDRYGTAQAVAESMAAGGLHLPTAIGIATGTAWPDALTGGAYCAAIGAPVFLPSPVLMANTSWNSLTANDSSGNWPIANVYVFGGIKAVDAATFAYVKRVTNAR